MASQLGFPGLFLLGLLIAKMCFQTCSRTTHSVSQGNDCGAWTKVKSKLFGIFSGNKRNLSLIYTKVCELEHAAKHIFVSPS